MDQIREIILKLKITELEAQLVLREIERAGLNRQIDDPNLDPSEKDRVLLRRERAIVEWGEIIMQLQDLRGLQEQELAPTPRVKLN